MKRNDAGQVLSEAYTNGTLSGLTMTNGYDSYLRRTAVALSQQSSTLVIFGYDSASRLIGVTNGNYSAGYTYLANSPLVSQILFKTNTTTRMTTTKQYDLLNRLQSISSVPSATGEQAASFAYTYNNANQRTRVNLADGSYWLYQYDSLGQVTGGKKYWSDGTPVAGEQMEYGFDHIGNRTGTKTGGDEYGGNLRSASYTVNNLNQYTQRTNAGYLDIMGIELATNAVTVNGLSTYRKGEFYRKELTVANTSTSVWQSITNAASGETSVIGNIFVPKTPEAFTYDLDGNLTSDGHWTNRWDAENRLIEVEALSSVPDGAKKKLVFGYDWQGRRISKTVSNWVSSAWALSETKRFAYDGWNLIAVLNGTNLLQSFVWGNDLSGTMQGAGGVGGLIAFNDTTNVHFVAYDGNGNVTRLVKGSDGTTSGNYEYGAFGEPMRVTGAASKLNPFRFSTKYTDDESDLLYYGYRYYNQSTGRWLSRDPMNAGGVESRYDLLVSCGLSLDAAELGANRRLEGTEYVMILNNPSIAYDLLGLCMPLKDSGPGEFHSNYWDHNRNHGPASSLTFKVCCPRLFPYLTSYGVRSTRLPPPKTRHGNIFPTSYTTEVPPTGSGPCYKIVINVTSTATMSAYFWDQFVNSVRISGSCCCTSSLKVSRNDPPTEIFPSLPPLSDLMP